ncbi:hypothetical protein Oweho_1353 [Owenweeksia hongkongensis DSM 17368]|uniref:RiboL-PSP-HEPN domain-containing protein n=2 Tax=Owenweeksia TaxID=267986 RepID=G8R7J7_OWEHD|nr:hypothetical protein Oweho_1353 [Owenweeksia hongkongensis DSM 17368]
MENKIDPLVKDREFKEAVGAFVIAFYELEFGLVFLCSMTDFDIYNRDYYLKKYIGMSLEQKRNVISDFIKEQMPELTEVWKSINSEIGQLNKDRRYIAHGFMSYHIPSENISTYIREKGVINERLLTVKEICTLTKRLYKVNTGENGVNGEFHVLFAKTRINKWNRVVNDKYKIV